MSEQSPPQSDPLIGTRAGHYTLLRSLGVGGMGSVYLAERNDGLVQQRVAIKLVARANARDHRRFAFEREILARLNHPNISHLIDADQLGDGTPYYVMDYVDGVPITDYAAAQQLDLVARLRLFIAVAQAVAHAHQALIVHRDIKPGNILVDAQGQPHLLDFGIAKPLLRYDPEESADTLSGRYFSPQHAAPEQLCGGQITPGCDVYGLGCLLYELLCARPPIVLSGLSAAEAEQRILHTMPEAPSERVRRHSESAEIAADYGQANVRSWIRALKGELDSIVLNCLRKLPEERYRSVDALVGDLQAHLGGHPIIARRGHRWYSTRKFLARHRWAASAVALTVIALIGSSVMTAMQSREAVRQRDAATEALTQAEAQRDRAQSVTEFLIDAFAAANPGGELGPSVTAKDILDHGARKLRTELGEQPALKAQLLATISEAQRALSMVDEAASSAHAARQLLDSQTQDSVRFDVLASSLRVYLAQRDTDDSYAVLTELSAFASTLHERLIVAELGARAYLNDARQVDMVEFLQRNLRELESAGPAAEDRGRLNILRLQLAEGLAAIDQPQPIPALLAQVDAEMREFPGGDPESQIILHQRISVVQRRAGRIDDAQRSAQIAVELAGSTFGEQSTRYLGALGALMNCAYDRGDYAKALEMGQRIITTYDQTFGPQSPKLVVSLSNTGNAAARLERFDEALGYYNRAVAIAETHFRADAKSLFTIRVNKALLLSRIPRCEQAIALAQLADSAFAKAPERDSAEAYPYLLEALLRCTNGGRFLPFSVTAG